MSNDLDLLRELDKLRKQIVSNISTSNTSKKKKKTTSETLDKFQELRAKAGLAPGYDDIAPMAGSTVGTLSGQSASQKVPQLITLPYKGGNPSVTTLPCTGDDDIGPVMMPLTGVYGSPIGTTQSRANNTPAKTGVYGAQLGTTDNEDEQTTSAKQARITYLRGYIADLQNRKATWMDTPEGQEQLSNYQATGGDAKHSKEFADEVDGDQEQFINLINSEYDRMIDEAMTELKTLDPTVEQSEWDFFQVPGAFKNGYDFGDVTKTILGTATDAGVGVMKGALNVGEGILDLGVHAVGWGADLVGADETADMLHRRASKNDVANSFSGVDKFLNGYSVFGRTTDSVMEGIGQVGTTMLTGGIGQAAGWGSAGVSALTYGTMGASSMGSGMSEAYANGASDWDAFTYGLISGVADTATEMFFGGLGKSVNMLGFSKGLSSADDILAKKISGMFSSQLMKNIAEFGVKASAEGLEEVLAGVISAWGKSITYMSDKDFSEILADENLLEQFVVGAITSGIAQGGGVYRATKTGTDFVTGLNQDEQKVIKRETNKIIAEAEKNGTKLTSRQKAEIQAQVEQGLEKGYISVDTIEEVLGGEGYKTYTDTVSRLDALQAEYDELYNLKGMEKSDAQTDRQAELKRQIDEIKMDFNRDQAKMQLSDQVYDIVKGGRLAESYNELARKHQAFTADLSKYNKKQQAVIQRAIDSGILNNTNRTHEFVDLIAKISADKGVLFDFTNNQKLKESGFAIDGKQVNGFVTKDGITLNVNAAKSLNKVVGHEIAHVLEGTELYAEMQRAVFSYATHKGEFRKRYDSLKELYKDVKDADIKAELTADLIGDYLFTDPEFIKNLSVNNRNVFRKMYDEIKYLCRVATAGSKELRQLEKAKKAFAEAYRASKADSKAQKNTAQDGGTQYDIAALENGNVYVKASRNVITGQTKAEQRRNITDFFNELLEGNPSIDIQTIEGDTLTITKAETANKARDDYKSVNGQQIAMSDEEFTVKMHIESHIDEVAEVSRRMNKATDNKNHSFAKDGFSYRRAYFEDFDGQYYEVTLSIGHNGTIATVYNVGKIKGSVSPSAKVIAVVGSKPLGETLSKSDIPHKKQNVKTQYSLSMVADVQPTSDTWHRGASTDEVRAAHPTLYAVDENATEKRNPTQVKGTVGSYRNVYEYLKSEGFNGTILDASSGLGYGTKAGIEEYGFNVEDIEPYPDKNYTPKYTDYSALDKKYDVVISNAVLNVLPQDQRDALVVKMGELLNPGGRMFVNVRGKDVLNSSNKIAIDEANMEYFIPRTEKTGSYQKGFTKAELKAYLEDALGAGYTVEPTNLFSGVGVVVTKDGAKYSLSDSETDNSYLDAVKRGDIDTAQMMVANVAKESGYNIEGYHGTDSQFWTFSLENRGRNGEMLGVGYYFTADKNKAELYSPKTGTVKHVYLDIKKPISHELMTISQQEWGQFLDFAEQHKDEYIDGMWKGNSINKEFELRDMLYFDNDADFIKTFIDTTAGRNATVAEGYLKMLKDSIGYDGLLYENGDAKVYVAFTPEQIKSADPITYDDNGKVIPLSERFNAEEKDIRFSLSESVEETNDLMALHNLTQDKLLKSLELGGLPMPSVAITKASIPHDNFGEITLILNKNSIDPKASKKNVVYSADAWTPIFPQVEYEADPNVSKQINNKLIDLGRKVEDVFKHDIDSIRYNYEGNLNRYGGEDGLIQYAMEKYGLKAAYLEDQGKHVDKITKQEEVPKAYNSANEAKYQAIADILDISSPEEIGKLNLKETAEQYGDQLENIYPGMTKSAMRMSRIFRQAMAYMEDASGAPVYSTVTDESAMRKAIDDAIDTEGFEVWTRELFSGIVKDKGIYNNKDLFTPSGNRKSFKQTHLPFTLENIVKAMASQNNGNTKNVSGFNGIKTLRAGTAERFKSIAEMHERKGRLQHLTQAEADQINDDLSKRLYNIMETIDNENGNKGSSNPFIRLDSIGETLMEISEGGKYNVADIQRVFAQYGHTISDDLAADIKQLLFDVSQMPVNIYEAKPERAVSFDEVGVFVIPRNADVKLKQELLNRGYAIAEYDPDVEGDRQKVVNQFEEYKFSLSNVGETQKLTGKYNVYGQDIALPSAMEDIAPVPQAETATETAETAQNVPILEDVPVVEDELFPDNTPIEQEIESLAQQVVDLEGQLLEMTEAGQFGEEFNRLSAEWSALRDKVKALEQEASESDEDRLSSLEDTDAPPEIGPVYNEQTETTPITKKLENDIARLVRSGLALRNKDMADAHRIIQGYVSGEIAGRDQLFNELKKYNSYTETQYDEDVAAAKDYLRTQPLKVDDTIKWGVADYNILQRQNFGKIRFSKNGSPVDVQYKELTEMWPHLFPESIYVPGDQFEQIVKVANMDSETVQEFEIPDEAIWNVADTIIRSVGEYRQAQKEKAANKYSRESFDSLMQDADRHIPQFSPEAYRRLSERPNVIDSGDIGPTVEVETDVRSKVEGQQTFIPSTDETEVAAQKPATRKELQQGIMDGIKDEFHVRGYELDDVLENAKNLSTFRTVDNTPQRVMEKALGYKEGRILSDLTVNKVAQNETEGIKWLNSFTDRKNGLLAQLSRRYHIKPGSKESAAAQMYAEGYYVTGTDKKSGEYVKGKSQIVQYGDAELAADFKDPVVRARIKNLAKDPRIRQIYDETLAAINESRKRNGYPEIPRLDNYFLHFRAMDDTFSRLGLPFNPNDIRAKDLPTDLNGVTADLKPGQPYFASAMHRRGKRTSFDLLGGLERYLTSAKNQIYHIDDIQTLRALRNYIADTYGQANGLEGLGELSEEEQQYRIEKVYDAHLSTFAKFLNEEANVLAGKTALIDRGLEGIIGRRGMTFLDTVNRQVGSNMVGFNVSSSLTNFLATVQAFAKTNKVDFVKGFGQTVANKVGSIFGRTDSFTENSPVIIRRKGAERFHRTPFQKVGDAGYVLMGAVDNISTELIARAKYNELTRKGMDSQQAHFETDKWVSALMGDRSLGQMPQLYNSKMLGLFTKFQLEVRNQLDSQFYDTIKETKASNEEIQNGLLRNAKTAAKVTSTFFQLAVAQHLFGKAFESVAGYNPAFDIIGVLMKAFGFDDDEESEDTVLDNLEQGFMELLGDLPYTSTLTGGRIPISSALPIEEFVKGEDQYGNEKSRWETLGEIAPYYILPGGYGQAKKTYQGLSMFDEDHPIAGSYTDNGDLRFPVADTPWNRIQAGLFGQWASDNARDYFDNDRKPLNEKQIQEFMDVGLTIQDYWAYRDGLKGLSTLAEKADYIDSLDLTDEQKNVLINNIADREEDIDMSDYDEYGDYEEFDFAMKNPEKYEFFQSNGISFSDYANAGEDMKRTYTWAYNNPEKYSFLKDNGVTLEDYSSFTDEQKDAYTWAYNNPDKFTLSKAVTSDLFEYRQYTGDLYDIRADKDRNGKSISGSAKEKKIAYINGLDIDYGAKIILFKSEYPADDTYNHDIIDYLNNRDDISYEEMVTILAELGFTVNGNSVTWD